MKPLRGIEEVVRGKLNATASAALHDRVLARIRGAQKQSDETTPARTESVIRRTIMRSPIVKLAIAAAVVAVIGLGVVEFIHTGSKSGVVWAQVAQKVNASRGVIFRIRGTGGGDPNMDWPKGYMMIRRSPLHSLTEWYHEGQIKRSLSFDLEAKTMLWAAHDVKVYYKEAMSDEKVRSAQAGGFTNPKELVDHFLAGTYKKLGRRTIDGIVCEGIETTDQAAFGANYPIQSFVGRMWVSVANGYPVLVETEADAGNDGTRHETAMGDQFQWDVEVSARECDIPIPPDYRLMD
jgi:hypothetical protein